MKKLTTVLGFWDGGIEPERQRAHGQDNSVVSAGEGVGRMEEGVGKKNGNGKKQYIITYLKRRSLFNQKLTSECLEY